MNRLIVAFLCTCPVSREMSEEQGIPSDKGLLMCWVVVGEMRKRLGGAPVVKDGNDGGGQCGFGVNIGQFCF